MKTIQEAADYLEIPVNTVRHHLYTSHKLEGERICGRRYFTIEELNNFKHSRVRLGRPQATFPPAILFRDDRGRRMARCPGCDKAATHQWWHYHRHICKAYKELQEAFDVIESG